MSVDKYLQSALIGSDADLAPANDIVISSRVRLARNLRDYRFPAHITASERDQLIGELTRIVADLEVDGIGGLDVFAISELGLMERQALVEKHLLSLNIANAVEAGAFAVNEDETVSLMIGEEDHLRIQAILPGLNIREAAELADALDNALCEQVDYAYDEKYGFLTSCPTNVGTGIRASVMLHLPALVVTKQINKIIGAATQVGLTVRGIYGEGSEPLGNLFQISNQVTLGRSEEEIILNLQGVVEQVIELERQRQQELLNNNRSEIVDQIQRNYGILANATIINSKEATERLSDLRLGAALDLIEGLSPRTVDELFVRIQPGYLQYVAGTELNEQERDVERAKIIRNRISNR